MIPFIDGLITTTLIDVTKKILKKDPIRSALDQTIDELKQERQTGWYELREIDRNRKEIFNNINIIEEATFLKILIDNGVLPEIALRLYKKFSEKFNENIKEGAKKEPGIFYPYVIREFESIKTENKELIKLLSGLTHKNEVYLDRFLKHFKELEKIPIKIPDIQEVLRKKETFEGEFFRKEPAWVDYEQGFMVERKEVDEIIKKLNNNNTIQLVLGAPASGKSIILKNIGFKLANKHKVYVVELKKHLQDEIKVFFENILKIDDDNPIFIVDDAHLFLSYCERLAKDFKSRGKGNLIIGLRETRKITKEHPKEGAEYELLSKLSKNAVHVQAEDVTEGIIKTFLEKQYHFEENRIQTVSFNLDKYENDLWLLSWALKAYNKDKDSVVVDEIYEKIASSIEEIRVGKDKEPINAEDVFLPLSIFYRYEIPIERYFLEQLGIDANLINQLIELQEIAETKDRGHKMLSLHHSSIAKLYFGAYQRFPDIGRRIKKKILYGKDEKELEYCCFYRYITTTDPRNAVDAVINLCVNVEEWADILRGWTLLKKLVEDYKIQELIKMGIENGSDLSRIAGARKHFAMKLVNGHINK